jgi:AcrR family transcriptional regulator
MATPKTSPKRSDGIETMARLMTQARIELAKNGVDNFDVEAVLERSEAARSSLYHHFGSKFDLIYTAQLEELAEGLNNDNQLFRYLVETSSSEEDFFKKLAELMTATSSKEMAKFRARRLQVLASATHNDKLAEAIRAAQVEGNLYFTESLEILRKRGWIDPQQDLHAVTYMIQGLLFGHVMLDFSQLPDLEEGWVDLAMQTIVNLVGASEKFKTLAKVPKKKTKSK